MIQKPKLLEIISYAIFLRSQLLQDRNRKMSLISSDPKFTDGEANGKKEVLENSNFWSTRRQALSEFWWEPKKLTNVSSTTLSKLNKFSVNWKHSRLAIMPGLGLHMIFQIKNHKLKNFAPNSPQKKTIKSLKLYLKRLVKTTKSFSILSPPKKTKNKTRNKKTKKKRSKRRNKRKANKLKKNNECDFINKSANLNNNFKN